MTWKSYAVVSGATVLAGWLASSPPASAPAAGTAARPEPSSRVPAAASDIEEQAARLHARVRQETAFRAPERNPFRFGARHAERSAADAVTPAPVEPIAPAPPPPPLVKLSGIAEDQLGERVQRTAVLSSPAGVLLVREGDEVLGQYRVARIHGDAVELLPLAGGGPLRLKLP
jgi:hypothetical protein